MNTKVPMYKHGDVVMFKDTAHNRSRRLVFKVGRIHYPNAWLGTMVQVVGESSISVLRTGRITPVYAYFLSDVDASEHLTRLEDSDEGGETND